MLDESGYDNSEGNENQVQALEELTAAYDKLSKMKWDTVRREYEATYRRSFVVQVNSDHSLRPASYDAKAPGKKRSQEVDLDL